MSSQRVIFGAVGADKGSFAHDTSLDLPVFSVKVGCLLIADRNSEIALARSAAPESISKDADVLVLGPHGYEPAVKGKNGFVCVVQRSWTAGWDDLDFWNPKLRAPICFNAPAARTYLPIVFRKTDLILGRVVESGDVRGGELGTRQEGIAAAGAWRDVLHVVEATV